MVCLKNLLPSLKISNFLRGFVWKTTQAWLGGKSCFSHTNPFNFRRLTQSLIWRYMAENLQVTYRLPNLNTLFQFLLTEFSKSDLFSCIQKVDHVSNY